LPTKKATKAPAKKAASPTRTTSAKRAATEVDLPSVKEPVITEEPAAPSGRLGIRKTYKLFIGGAFPRSESGRSYVVTDASGGFLANAALASRKDVRDAVLAARAAVSKWAGATAYNRGQILYRIAEMLEGRRDQFIAEVRAAEGVPAETAAASVDAAIDRWVWYAGWADKIAGVLGAVHPVTGPYVGWSAPRPVGVVGAVSLPSLPALVEALAPVLAAGATAVVLVPHERPVAAAALAEVLASAELPAGAANVLTGPVGELATRLTGVDGLDLTGAPDDVAPDVITAAAERGARILAQPVIDDPPLSRLRAWSEVTTVWHPVGR
jgi:acyl-CoA reductase-like NAD-dependent aldehyde dehydrogenase